MILAFPPNDQPVIEVAARCGYRRLVISKMRILLLAPAWATQIASAASGKGYLCGPDPVDLPVRVYNIAEVRHVELRQAMQVAGEVYGRAGIRLKWTFGDPSNSEAHETDFSAEVTEEVLPPLHPGPLVVRVVAHAPAGLPQGALAFSLPFAHHGADVTIFADRATTLRRSLGTSYSQILGFAVAHELGHILLRSGAHSPIGIMQAIWTLGDWQRVATARLGFGALECERMKTTLDPRLSGRAIATRLPNATDIERAPKLRK